MTLLFWICLAVIVYVYAGYPLGLWLLSRLKSPRPPSVVAEWPYTSLIIAAYNEESDIREKLVNSLSLNYPREKLEIMVVSDGSTDQTDPIVEGFAPQGVQLIRLEGRQGKTAAQNAAASRATGDILVFSDANALYEPDAIQQLVRHFERNDIGCVEGQRVDFTAEPSASAEHELTYRDWESLLKSWESRVLSCTGATGPIYAIRRSLYVPLDPAMISDFMEPMLVMCRHGKRHVFEPGAVSCEVVLPKMSDEFRRKVRIMTRCLNSLKQAPEVLNPFRCGWFAIQVISHRMLRWLVPVFALGAFIATVFLLHHPFYRLTLLLEMLFLLVAHAGAVLDRFDLGPAFLRLPHYVFTANLASLQAIGNCLLGRTIVTWRTERSTSGASPATRNLTNGFPRKLPLTPAG